MHLIFLVLLLRSTDAEFRGTKFQFHLSLLGILRCVILHLNHNVPVCCAAFYTTEYYAPSAFPIFQSRSRQCHKGWPLVWYFHGSPLLGGLSSRPPIFPAISHLLFHRFLGSCLLARWRLGTIGTVSLRYRRDGTMHTIISLVHIIRWNIGLAVEYSVFRHTIK